MPIPTNKEELIQAITDEYRKLSIELSNVPIEWVNNKELEGHQKNTLISINNLISYLIGWGELVLKWDDRKSNNLEVTFPESGFKWNQLGKLAQKFYKDHQDDEFPVLILKLEETINKILVLIETKTNLELYETAWYDKWTQGRMIQLNTSSPFKNARERIRKWKKTRIQN